MKNSDSPTPVQPAKIDITSFRQRDLTSPAEPIFLDDVDGETEHDRRLSGTSIQHLPNKITNDAVCLPGITYSGPEEVSFPRCPNVWQHPLRATSWLIQAVVGVVSLILLLAVVAAIPLVNLWALGYLLEAQARVARTGRWRMMFHLLDRAPRLGTIVLGIFFWLLPLRLLASLTADARLIDPAGASAQKLATATTIAAIFVFVHLCLALGRGGTVGCFLRPIKNLRWMFTQLRHGWNSSRAAVAVKGFLSGFRIGYHFWLGLRGLAIALIWLVIPTSLFAVAKTGAQISAPAEFLGGFLMLPVLCWLPFLQVRFAAENRFKAGFEVGLVRNMFKSAPIYWMLALLTLYVFTLPLYLFKIVALPRDVVWFATTVFLVSIYPARVFLGWTYHRALIAKKRRGWFVTWTCRLLILLIVSSYTFLLFFTQAVGARGRDVLFEQPAFLLPTPF